MDIPYVFSFDVESVGLYGKGFWVGYVVMDRQLNIHDRDSLFVEPQINWGSFEDMNWITENVLPHFKRGIDIQIADLRIMRSIFWDKLQEWKENNAIILADCAYPVETNFLRECVLDDEENRKWNAPYPLVDLGGILIANHIDPTREFKRWDSEIKHHPMWDAHQSARIFFKLMTVNIPTTNPSL